MICPSCKQMMSCGQGKHHYLESGLDNVYLLGIDICECSCGERIVSIPSAIELHDKLALEIMKKKSLLNGREIRFLRKNMGLTAIRLAELMAVDNATVSRWENGHQPISETNDRLLRSLYLNMKDIPSDKVHSLIEKDFVEISSDQTTPPPYMIPVEDWSDISG